MRKITAGIRRFRLSIKYRIWRKYMNLIEWLGNPTKQYEGTRHTVGFETIDRIAAENQSRVEAQKHKAL
mgnify:CR=1 FL=1